MAIPTQSILVTEELKYSITTLPPTIPNVKTFVTKWSVTFMREKSE